MASKTQRRLSGFVSEVRIGNFGVQGSGIVPPQRTASRVRIHKTENTTEYDVAGKDTGQGSIAFLTPQSTEFGRLRQIATDELLVPIMFGAGTTVGDFQVMSLGRLFGRNFTNEDDLMGYSSDYSEETFWEPGECRFSSVGGSGVSSATNGTGKQYAGGVASGEQMVAMLIPYNRTGASSTLNAYWRSYSDSGYTTDQTTHKTFAFTSTGGGVALRGASDASTGYHVSLDGDSAAITNEYFRFEIDAPSAGTWYLFGAVAHWTK